MKNGNGGTPPHISKIVFHETSAHQQTWCQSKANVKENAYTVVDHEN